MSLNDAGVEMTTVKVNLDAALAEALREQAEKMRLSTAQYCRIAIQQWLDTETLPPISE